MPLSAVSSQADAPEWDNVGRMIGDATIVALSEAAHEIAEPLEFRNQLLRYLVEKKGFTAIALESGLTESRLVNNFVREGAGDLATVAAEGISWNLGELAQNQALVRWLRDYNADPRNTQKVHFYGFDVPGSPGESGARRNLQTALTEALKYVDRVDSTASAAFHARLDPLLPSLRFDLYRPMEGPSYGRLSQAQRDALTAIVADLIGSFERREADYLAASSADDYEWAYRAAIGARQLDGWLRSIPLGWQPSSSAEGFPRFLSAADDVRDRAQADNLDWIIKREGSSGKALIYAARYHVSTAPVKAHWYGPKDADHPKQEVMGTYLRQRFGKKLVTIGHLMSGGEIGSEGSRCSLIAVPGSFDALVSKLNVPVFMLHLRTAPAEITCWLVQEHVIGHGDWVLSLAIGRAFDVLFYTDTVHPAAVGTLVDCRRIPVEGCIPS
jgi:erythromycin esterase